NNNDRFEEADDEFDILYDTSVITITNKTGFSWPAGTKILAGLGRADAVGEFRQAGAQADVGGALTGSTDGDLADVTDLDTDDTYADAAVNAAIAEINLNFKELQAAHNALLAKLR